MLEYECLIKLNIFILVFIYLIDFAIKIFDFIFKIYLYFELVYIFIFVKFKHLF